MGFSIIEFIIDTEDFKENETKAKKLNINTEKRKCQRKKNMSSQLLLTTSSKR